MVAPPSQQQEEVSGPVVETTKQEEVSGPDSPMHPHGQVSPTSPPGPEVPLVQPGLEVSLLTLPGPKAPASPADLGVQVQALHLDLDPLLLLHPSRI